MIQFISHFTDQYSYLDSIRMALEGGCKWIQLRMKGASDDEMQSTALEAQAMCREANATFIIDDHVELVKKIGADGVHLGKKDMPIKDARDFLGNKFIIGGTANTFEDVKAHYEAGANYIGCGPFRFTTTKQGLSPILGLDGYRNITRQMSLPVSLGGINWNPSDFPIVAIGGITADDIPSIMSTGVTGIALSGTVLRADSPVEEMKRLIKLLNEI